MTQVSIPVEVNLGEVTRKRDLGQAIALCAELGGLEPKQIKVDGKFIDKAQWSRWVSGDEGIKWPKLRDVMDQAGNDVPVLWMAHSRQYDIAGMRLLETKVERENRELREENAALKRAMRSTFS